MRFFFKASVSAIGVFIVSSGWAYDNSSSRQAHDAQATQQTLNLLNDKNSREKSIRKNPEAQKADQDVKNLTGNDPALNQEMYELAAQIFPDIQKQAGGDPAKMQELMTKALRDPAAFANSLSPEQQRRIQELGKKIESRSAPRQK